MTAPQPEDRELDALIGRSEAALEDLLENIDDIVVLSTVSGSRILYVNRAWRERLGYDEEDVRTMSAHAILHPMHAAEVKANDPKLLAGETLRGIERTLVAKDGTQFFVEGCVNFRFKDGRPWYARAIFHDITERKRAERMKDDLLAMANHEMRSPLMAILMALELVQKDAEVLPERARRMMAAALSNSQRLLNLVNAYLDLTRMESGGAPLRRSPLDLTALVERALETNRPLAERAGVTLALGDGPSGATVDADAERVQQVLTNFIANAIKFSPAGAEIRATVARRGSHLRAAIADRGPGVPADFRDKLFGKFAQAEGHGRGGTGLGLAISKAIVERHGGTVGHEDAAGGGSVFWFELPESAEGR